ncbi:poly(ethylene terephthalate) hydrolase family protein [Actinophytocola algeriensis]|uniref:Alpha-beta hydrolase superfamily lysophospholipase n=1 Tax=Actinophytocola algeriensis TaxID=1768010 RepID=A0A7W7Q980_9PSEU|nr:dienelactone hydrolase family protein [Actinophytocola algeriensis]MBB4909203.1 alpha-beta hydrolase superfamily lysophospholipase [Actinophytocola algeriensis]MBE1474409.1 alpha-beta hydrolase superfamily lysophospholipase [Actinophytocola algeriensis]
MRIRSILCALSASALLVAGTPAQAAVPVAANPYERGPAPTTSSIEASRGPFAVASVTVSRSSASGFGGGTVYYPTSTTEGTFGAVAISPGFTASQSSVAWLGPRLASQGFVVITIDTLSTLDQPDSRGGQLLAALDYVRNTSSVRTRVDGTRLGVMGHSMGGGGSLAASRTRPTIQAAVPLTPWHGTKSWSTVGVPTMIIGAENDRVAPVSSHSEPFYTSMSAAQDKAYLELNNASHSAPTSANTTVARYSISWLKRFIDNDTRYEQFLCPAPGPSNLIQEYRDTCPHS